MKNLVILLILILSVTSIQAKTIDSIFNGSKHTVYFEFFGNAPIFSLNYEYVLAQYSNSKLVQSIGMDVPVLSDKEPYLINGKIVEQKRIESLFIPIRVNWISNSSSKNHLALGAGITYYNNLRGVTLIDVINEDVAIRLAPFKDVFFIPSLGYRFTGTKGVVFRLTVSPYLSRNTRPQVQPHAGLSFGYNFRKGGRNEKD